MNLKAFSFFLFCGHRFQAFRTFPVFRINRLTSIKKMSTIEIPSTTPLETVADPQDGLKECIQHRTDREVICGDSIEWLNGFTDDGLPAGYCGFTSLPDLSEVQNIFQTDTVAYKKWFTDTVALFMRKLSRGTYVVFLQSDIRYMTESGEVTQWIDKSFLCSTAAEREGCTLMWHKLVRSHLYFFLFKLCMCCDPGTETSATVIDSVLANA